MHTLVVRTLGRQMLTWLLLCFLGAVTGELTSHLLESKEKKQTSSLEEEPEGKE